MTTQNTIDNGIVGTENVETGNAKTGNAKTGNAKTGNADPAAVEANTGTKTGAASSKPRRKTKADGREHNAKHGIPRMGLTRQEFCASFGMAVRTYEYMQDAGRGPKEIKEGRFITIPMENIAEWVRERAK